MIANNARKKYRLIFSRNIKLARLKNSISQEELAYLSGMHRTYIGSVERGERNISIDNMERLANALNLTISELLNDNQTSP